MKKYLKKAYLSIALLLTLLFACFLGGCTQLNNNTTGNKTTDFVGTYKSFFVDSQNDADQISFSLEITKDNTFELTRYDNGDYKTYSGYCKSYTENGQTQLLCLVEEGYKANDYHPNAWNPYFSVCMLDDGSLMATAGTTSSATSVVTAFGSGSITRITLVLFEKE